MGYEVTWNDMRAELTDYVRLKQEFGTIHFAPGNAFSVELPSLFDGVLITEVIEHTAHPDELLGRAAQLVRPGGYVVMTTPNGTCFRNHLPKFTESSDPAVYESVQFKPDTDGHIFLLHPEEAEPLAARGARAQETDLKTVVHADGTAPPPAGGKSNLVCASASLGMTRSSYRGRSTQHGFPTAITFSGTSRVTTEHAPTMARAPMFTPGITNARAPTNASPPIVIFATTSGMDGFEKSWLPVLKYASCATTARGPISISPRL
jgi:Methyltransferase domain